LTLVVFQQVSHTSHKKDNSERLLQFIKIGSACLFDEQNKINYELLRRKAREIEINKEYNTLVVSGAIALGMREENDFRKKEELNSNELRGYASLGQIVLMDLYSSVFRKKVCQLLVTERDMALKKDINELLIENAKKGRITLINYNDCIDFEEIKKDNDTLAAEILLNCNGDRLMILGENYAGFNDSNGNLIERVSEVSEEHYRFCNGKSKLGNGGFKTKLDAARLILNAGKEMIVSNINYELEDIIDGQAKRTLFRG
jgi:glutamate 5-kinase